MDTLDLILVVACFLTLMMMTSCCGLPKALFRMVFQLQDDITMTWYTECPCWKVTDDMTKLTLKGKNNHLHKAFSKQLFNSFDYKKVVILLKIENKRKNDDLRIGISNTVDYYGLYETFHKNNLIKIIVDFDMVTVDYVIIKRQTRYQNYSNIDATKFLYRPCRLYVASQHNNDCLKILSCQVIRRPFYEKNIFKMKKELAKRDLKIEQLEQKMKAHQDKLSDIFSLRSCIFVPLASFPFFNTHFSFYCCSGFFVFLLQKAKNQLSTRTRK